MKFQTDYEIAEYLRNKQVQKLINRKCLEPILSYEQYSSAVKTAKAKTEHKLFTNCYLMKHEIQRLIDLGSFYQIIYENDNCNGVTFVGDERSHYRVFVYVDPNRDFGIPRLDRSALIETVYLDGRESEQQKNFESRLKKADFHFYMKYHQIDCTPRLEPKEFWRKYHAIDKFMKVDGVRVCIPNDEQLCQFYEIYREEIDIYTQTYCSMDERRAQREAGYLYCLSDRQDQVYAISMSGRIYGGAIAVKREYVSNMYGTALMFGAVKGFYEDMPDDMYQRTEYMRPKAFGWIATMNSASRRVHGSLKVLNTGKAMNQFIRAGYVY